jgi:hypothetical protein
MAERSFFDALLGRKQKAQTTVERLCPAGKHPLDPGWSKCPYCEAESGANAPSRPTIPPPAPGRRRTVVDGAGVAAAPGETRLNTSQAAPSPPSRAATKVDPQSGGSSDAERHAGGGRRLMGILTTYTWSRLGTLCKVYDGRNYAGSGAVAANNNMLCDIHVPEDGSMSAAHFLVLFQGSKVIISDERSTNGTYVNGEQIDTRGVDLPDGAVIKAGATVFVFQRIRLAQAAPAAAPKPDGEVWRPGGREDELS